MSIEKSRSWSVVGVLHAAYKIALSPFFGNACRFHPSCSTYARDAIHRYGWLRGGWLALKRIVRCRQGHPGGVDPVP